jgi:hypothetical protein
VRATRELEELGDLARPALQKVLGQKPSEEVRARATRLLQQVEVPITAPEMLRTLRGIEVLEHAGTPEARALLEALAGGAADARPTWEAKASLKRLQPRQVDGFASAAPARQEQEFFLEIFM